MKHIKPLTHKLTFEHDGAVYRAAVDTIEVINENETEMTFVKLSGNDDASEFINARVYTHPEYAKLKTFVDRLEEYTVSMNIELSALKDNVSRDYNKEDSLEEHEQLFPVNKAMKTVYDYYNKELDNMILNGDVYFVIIDDRLCGERL